MTTASDFRAALGRAGLTGAELCRRLGINPATVHRWSTGKLDVPRYAMAYLEVCSERDQAMAELAVEETDAA